ncbi:hypothetical protein D9M70_491270 [compost metagenome]
MSPSVSERPTLSAPIRSNVWCHWLASSSTGVAVIATRRAESLRRITPSSIRDSPLSSPRLLCASSMITRSKIPSPRPTARSNSRRRSRSWPRRYPARSITVGQDDREYSSFISRRAGCSSGRPLIAVAMHSAARKGAFTHRPSSVAKCLPGHGCSPHNNLLNPSGCRSAVSRRHLA